MAYLRDQFDVLLAHPNTPKERKYQLLSVLGEGGTGITYKAQLADRAQPVAIKVLALSNQNTWDHVERFQQEAKILAKLQYPGIPRYLDYFHLDTKQDRLFCLVQQLAEGKSLAQWIEQGRHFSEQQVRAIAAQVLKLLVYLQRQDPPMTHRDIKPNNIILDKQNKVSLVDFGAVKNAYYDTIMQGNTMVGTFGYMAPEQFRGQSTPNTDLYGLGATLLFLLTHRSPTEFPVENLRLKLDRNSSMSDDFCLWLEKMLEPDHHERFTTAAEALTALTQGMPRPRQHGISKPQLIAIGAAIAILFGGLNLFKYPILSALGFTPREMFEEGINAGNVAIVKKYLDKGVSPNANAYNGNSLLHWAVSNGELEVVTLLLERGANVHKIYKPDERTVLHLGVQHDNPGITEVLLQYGALVEVSDLEGNTALHKALLKEDIRRYYGMQNNSPIPVEQNITQLIAAGANPDQPNHNGLTPRAIATSKGLEYLFN